jgi:hypothetical protein
VNKTEDIEFEMLCGLDDGPVTLADLEAKRFEWVDDRRWIGVALYRMLRDGRLRMVGCDVNHMHEGDCVVEVAR